MAKPLTIEDIKKAILPSMAELFETHAQNTKTGFAGVGKKFEQFEKKFEQFEKKFEQLDNKIERHTHETKVLLEQMDKKIDVAIEFSSKAVEDVSVTKDHSKRIQKLESEVNVIKKVIKSV